MKAKWPARKIPAAAASHTHANFLGTFTMAHMTATTASPPSMSKAMYQRGQFNSEGKNVAGWIQLRKENPARILHTAFGIPQSTAYTATRVSANAT